MASGKKLCVVCAAHPRVGFGMCKGCGTSYDRSLQRGSGTAFDAIEWAAKRARRFEHARCRRLHGEQVG